MTKKEILPKNSKYSILREQNGIFKLKKNVDDIISMYFPETLMLIIQSVQAITEQSQISCDIL